MMGWIFKIGFSLARFNQINHSNEEKKTFLIIFLTMI